MPRLCAVLASGIIPSNGRLGIASALLLADRPPNDEDAYWGEDERRVEYRGGKQCKRSSLHNRLLPPNTYVSQRLCSLLSRTMFGATVVSVMRDDAFSSD